MSRKVIIIGGGIGGLATAALLAKDGYDVTLLEKNKMVGGRASIWEKDGFTFDLGPSWYMMPDAFEHFFSLFGKKPGDYYELIKLNPRYTVFFDDKKKYTMTNSLAETKKIFDTFEKKGGEKLTQFINTARKRYTFAMKDLVRIPYQSIIPLLHPGIISKFPEMGLFTSFHNEVSRSFKNKYLQKILEFTTVFLGGSPYITPAFYTLIAHTDFNLKIWHPKGGIYKVIESLISLCKENGVKIVTNEEVVKIVVKDNTVSSVKTRMKLYEADIVVTNADYAYAETQLLDKQYQSYSESYWNKKTLSPSALMIYLGLNKKLKQVTHHNLYFSDTWDTHFKGVYESHRWPQDPSYYVNIPTITDPTMAPKKNEAIIFLVPVSPHIKDTGREREKLAAKIINHFQKLIQDDFQKNIVIRRLFSHRDFQSSYNAYNGAAFGIAHTLFQTGPFRPNNKSKKVKNLYYAGQYTNPGIGLPPCLISAEIVWNLIKNES